MITRARVTRRDEAGTHSPTRFSARRERQRCSTLLIFAVLLVLIMINLPIAVAMALTAIAFFVGLDGTSLLTMLPQRMYASTTGFTLLAIPFFILAGNLMNTGGVTSRIFRLCAGA